MSASWKLRSLMFLLAQVCVHVQSEGCDNITTVGDLVLACGENVQRQLMAAVESKTLDQIITYCANDVGKLLSVLDEECTKFYADCPTEVVNILDRNIQSAKLLINAYCDSANGLTSRCLDDMEKCVSEMMRKIQANGIMSLTHAFQILAQPFLNQTLFCSVYREVEPVTVTICLEEALAKCADSPDEHRLRDLHRVATSVKYGCAQKCNNMAALIEASRSCLRDAKEMHIQGEGDIDDIQQETCQTINSEVQRCIEVKSRCCEVVVAEVKKDIVGPLARYPYLNDVCPLLGEIFNGLCQPREEEEAEEEEEEEEVEDVKDGDKMTEAGEKGQQSKVLSLKNAGRLPLAVPEYLLVIMLGLVHL